MSFFVSESIKDIVDENSLIESNNKPNSTYSSVGLVLNDQGRNIQFDIKKVSFKPGNDLDEQRVCLFFECSDRYIEMIYFKKTKSAFLKLVNTEIEISDYSIDSITQDSKDTYIISLLCYLDR